MFYILCIIISILCCHALLKMYRMLDAHLYFKHEKARSVVEAIERERRVRNIRRRYQ